MRASGFGWRAACAAWGEPRPPRLSPWGKRERGIRFLAAAGQFELRCADVQTRWFCVLALLPLLSQITVTDIYVSILSDQLSGNLQAPPTRAVLLSAL